MSEAHALLFNTHINPVKQVLLRKLRQKVVKLFTKVTQARKWWPQGSVPGIVLWNPARTPPPKAVPTHCWWSLLLITLAQIEFAKYFKAVL